MKKLKIAIFSEIYLPTINGVVVSIQTFKKELEKRGHTIYIFAPENKNYKDEKNVFRFPSFEIPKLNFYPVAFPWVKYSSFSGKWFEIASSCDLVHSQHLFTMGNLGLRTARKAKIPIVYTYHTLIADYVHYVPLVGSIFKSYIIHLSRKYCNAVDQVVTPSQPMKKKLIEYGVKTNIEPISTGVYLEKFTREDSTKFRTENNIAKEDKILLFVGRMAAEKNVEFLLKAFPKINERCPNTHLVLVGSGPDEKKYQNFAQKLPCFKKISFLGQRPKEETEKIFGYSDLYVFPSITETQGIVVVEAMAAGTVPVAINKLGPSEIIDSGINGYLSELDEEDFSHRVCDLVQNEEKRQKFALAAKEKAKEYSAQNCAQKMENLYYKLLEEKSTQKDLT